MPNSNPSVWETWVSRDCWGQYHGTPTEEGSEDFAIRLGEGGMITPTAVIPIIIKVPQCIHQGKKQASFYRKKLSQPFLCCSDPAWLYSNGLTDIQEGIFTVFKKEINSSVHNVLTRMLSLKFCILSSALNHWVNGKKIRHKPKINLFCSPKTTSWKCCS